MPVNGHTNIGNCQYTLTLAVACVRTEYTQIRRKLFKTWLLLHITPFT